MAPSSVMASPKHPIRSSQILGLSLVGISIGSHDSVLCFSPKKDFARASSPSPSENDDGCHRRDLHSLGVLRQHSSGRRWKNRRKTQTFLPSPVRNVSPEDEDALMNQLGYIPPNVCCVSARSGDLSSASGGDGEYTLTGTSILGVGRPIAIKSYPLLVQLANIDANGSDTNDEVIYHGNEVFCGSNKIPFPTLYWLSCPLVSRAISELEHKGYVRILQQRLEDNEELGARWWECHEDYAAERWSLLSVHDREWLLQEKMLRGDEKEDQKRKSMRDMIQTSGVAGTDHHLGGSGGIFVPSVKCLHSHYAHYRSQLSRSYARNDGDGKVVLNMVGKWTHELLLESFPDIVL